MFNKLLFSTLCLTLFHFSLNAQTAIYSEDFEGTSHSFTLNSTDLNSTATGFNLWLVNNAYTGGAISVCGLPANPQTTPAQPSGITNNPSSKYMHISSTSGNTAGVGNCHFAASDGGLFCVPDENYFTKMGSNINTSGYDSIEVSFYYLCAGSPTMFGEMYYSTDGGTSWTLAATNLTGQSSWMQRKVTLPAFLNQSSFRIGFRFVNNFALSAADPALAVDQIQVTGFSNNNIAAPTFSGTAYCPGDNLAVSYTANGSYNSGNIFTAELSDAVGSFASATAIGSVNATSSGTINATIPGAALAGTGYRIRVLASTPSTTSPDNGTNITIAAGATAGTASNVADSICSGSTTGISLSGYTGSIIWESSGDGNIWTASSYSGDNFTTNALSQDLYLRAILQNSCGNDTSNIIHIVVVSSPAASFNYSQSGLSLNVSFTNNTSGTYSSVSWNFGDGNSTTNDSPTHLYTQDGSYIVSLTVTNDFGCSSVFTDTINVVPVAVKLVENLSINNLQVLPNPNNGQFQVKLELASGQDLQIYLTDVNGRRLGTLHNGYLTGGVHFIQNNEYYEALSTGLYILDIQGENGRQRYKVSIVR